MLNIKPNIKNKKIMIPVAVGLLCVIVLGGYFLIQQSSSGKTTTVAREETVKRGDLMVSLTEEGTASVTTNTTKMDLTVQIDSDTRLDLDVLIDEVLVRAGETVTEGQPLFVINQESLDQAIDTLDDAYQQAALDLQQAELDLALGQTSASGTKAENSNTAESAEITYQNTVTQMELKVVSLKKTLSEAEADYDEKSKLAALYDIRRATLNNMKAIVDHYEDALEALQDYYVDYTEKNATAISSYNTYANKLDSLNKTLSSAQSTYENYANSNSSEKDKYYESYMQAADSFNKALEIVNEYQSVIDEYDTLEDRIEDAEDCLEKAKEAYNDYNDDFKEWYGSKTKKEVDREVANLELSVQEAQLNLDQYLTNYDLNLAKAENTKNNAAINGEIADLTYASTTNKLQQKVISARLKANNLKAYVDEFQKYLDDNIIISPCNGLVTNIPFKAGDEIDLSNSYITIAQNGSISISLSIDQEDITSVSLDQEAVVTLDASKKSYTGWVDAISVSPASMGMPTVNYTITVRVIDESLTDVYEGMSCSVDLVSKQMKDVLYVSKRALSTKDGKRYVKVKQADGTIVEQEVTVGFNDGTNYEIQSGLQEGDVILIESTVAAGSGSSSANTSSNQASGDAAMPDFGSSMPSGSMPSGMQPPSDFGNGGKRNGSQ